MLRGTLTANVLAMFTAGRARPAKSRPTQAIKRTPLQHFDVPETHYETVIALADIAPNVAIGGRHTHPGLESGYLLDGELVLMVHGLPHKRVKKGESYLIASGAIHEQQTGPNGAKVIATYVVEKGKPLASPAPQ
jgi:quercetin dioxygenase-like cupin family protein